jgi:signal transduction histidine kinase
MTLPRRLTLAIAASLASLLVVLAVLGLASRSIEALLDAAEWRSHTRQVHEQIQRVLTLMVDAETGVRGFVLSGEGRFLEPYDDALARLPDALGSLRRLTAEEPSQQANVSDIERLAQARLATLAERVHGGRENAPTLSPAEVADLARGKEMMDAFRAAVDRARRREAELLQEREAAVQRSTVRVERDLKVGAAVATALLIAGLLGFGREIRLRWRTERELQRQTGVLRSVLESIADGVAVVDPQGEFLVFNRSGQRMLGVTAARGGPAAWPQHFGLFLPDGVTPYPSHELPLPRALRGETVRDVEVVIRNPHLESPILTATTASPLRGPADEILGGVAVFRNVTHEREAERALRAAKDAAERARDEAQLAREAAEAANAELEAFSYSVSHDLRAPLRALDGFSQALLEDYGDRIDAEGKSYLERVRAAAQRMALLIDDLIRLSRISRTELAPQATDVTALAREVVQEVQGREPQRSGNVCVEDGLRARVDPRLFRVALENLIANAWKFTRGTAEAQIHVGADRSNGRTAFFVRDNGAGFDMAHADKLFGAFQRLHSSREFEGTGIGLATVARVVHRHGGRIWAEAAPGAGATFYFTLGAFNDRTPEEVA